MSPNNKFVVVHRGARDAYQVARALHEAGKLESLVTDLYWPADAGWARRVENIVPAGIRAQLRQRNEPGLPGDQVSLRALSGLVSFGVEKLPRAPFSWLQRSMRWNDTELGQAAGRMAEARDAGLLAYSYYGFDAFRNFCSNKPSILFQMHPHPAVMRRILREELEAHPNCAQSLNTEWELALPEEDYSRLVRETRMARHWIAASTFTKNTMIEEGIPAERIQVVPYGVDLQKFRPSSVPTTTSGPLKLLFVGRINQRKGIQYLLDALRLVGRRNVELMVCGRVVDDLSIFRPFASQVTIRPSVSHAELLAAYQHADLFVFPSIAEGFAHVLLESMACGLPVLSTTHTAAPDLVSEEEDGFVVEPRKSELLASRIEWALLHRDRLHRMKANARKKAEQFTWARFRSEIVAAVDRCRTETEPAVLRERPAEQEAAPLV